MDIIVGGGKYGCIAVEYLRQNRRGFVLVDKDPNCLATERFRLKPYAQIGVEGEYFLEGDIVQVLELIERLKPEYVFPTAPVHIAAELAKSKFELAPWNEVIDCILANLPASVVLHAGSGNLIVSYNRDKDCLERCDAPEVCPSTRKRKPFTMDKLMKFAYPEGILLVSYQLAPGMGALKGNELLELFAQAEKKDKFVVATACGCHGYFTALKKEPRYKAKK
ncbi:hypothetical protein JXA31_02295 [Candidatus Bathyarchaeota archaeon]|nr:hypothetical protein [Candidatus Bathyarchaeota archaeon]